jgi:hypothetical protein
MINTPWGTNKERCIKLFTCVKCQKPVEKRIHSNAGWREYKISGLCEVCYDEIFAGDDDES